ncbi:MAG: phenylalanine--tRNA ligase subunit alpha, partial [Halobacterium sp.]
MQLPESQVAVLNAASATEARTIDQLAEATNRKPETVTGAVFELRDDGLLAVEERVEETVELTAEGERYARDALPELRFYEAAVELGADDAAVPMGQVVGASGLEGPQVNIALSNFARKGYGSIDDGDVRLDADADPEADPEARVLDALAAGEDVDADADLLDRLESRGLVARDERTVRSVTLTDAGVTALMEGVEAAETVDRLTPELLTSGEWRDVEFTEYNVEADAPEVRGGRTHILRQTADRVKDVLVGMGFEEMEGPHADAEFWINDCLFMPQD